MTNVRLIPTKRFVVVLSGWLFIACAAFASSNEAVIYSFQGGGDSEDPQSGLVADAAGNLYGTTFGQFGSQGTVFKLTAPGKIGDPWVETILYDFSAPNDGKGPIGNLIFDAQGNLYGVTQTGGQGQGGIVYELTPQAEGAWTETILFEFSEVSEGIGPEAGLVFDKAGNLYGTASRGGNPTCSCGLVFELQPPAQSGGAWTETTLYQFRGSLPHGTDGATPNSALIIDGEGDLVGTTESGGSIANLGTVFALRYENGRWVEKVLHAFSGADGGNPSGGIVLHGGSIYGANSNYGADGYGTVFQLSASGGGVFTETTLYNFSGGNDADPIGPISVDASGNLYGAAYGATHSFNGSVFKVAPPTQKGGAWSESTVYAFDGDPDAQYPHGGVIVGKGGFLYGTSQSGGAENNGSVFAVTP